MICYNSRTRIMWALALGMALGSVACSSKLSGEIDLNGEKLAIDSCRNGVVYNFRGVELNAKNGVRLRIAATQTGEAYVVVVPKDATVGTEVGTCGTLSITDQSSKINDVTNVKGTARLECAAKGFTIKGDVSFENCH